MTQIIGTDGNDELAGKTGQDLIMGKKGDDVLTGSSASTHELLVDGGFESSKVGDNSWSHYKTVGGWKSDSEVEVWGKGFYGQKSDVAELDFDSGKKLSNIYQDVATQAGVEYTFGFDYAKRPDSKLGTDTIEVWWNGVKVGEVDPTSTTWARAEFKVTGTGGTDRIEFREQADGKDNDSYGGLIDNASLKASSNGDVIMGGSGNDEISGNGGDDVIYGGAIPTGKPHVVTLADNDVIHAGDGNDTVYGNAGDDKIFGENGNDTMSGGQGNDTMSGGQGSDALSGNSGDDVIRGNQGDDTLAGSKGNDKLFGGQGNDKLDGGSGDDVLRGGMGDDDLTGGAGNDRLFGGKGNDELSGGSGDDVLTDNYGTNVLSGGSGFDTLDLSRAGSSVTVDLSKKTADGKDFANTFSGIEAVKGSAFDDTVKGDKSDNVIDGGAGDDWLRGLGGSDTMTGGKGSDTFFWERKDVAGAVDHITDFSAEDTLDLTGLIKGTKWSDIDEVVSIKDDGQNSHVYVNIQGNFTEVAVLDNVTGLSADDLLHSGMILA